MEIRAFHDLAADRNLAQTVDVNEITFTVEPCVETGGYVARWDDPSGRGGITTQGETIQELEAMVAEAAGAYFEPGQLPPRARLHFVEDPVLVLA